MSDRTDPRSTTSLLSEAMSHVTGLVRKELDLVRAELNESATRAAVAVGLIVGALVVLLVALNVLSAAIVAGLVELGLESGWASLLLGGVYFLIALAMIRKGTNDLKATNLAPRRSASSVKRDANAIKETING